MRYDYLKSECATTNEIMKDKAFGNYLQSLVSFAILFLVLFHCSMKKSIFKQKFMALLFKFSS